MPHRTETRTQQLLNERRFVYYISPIGAFVPGKGFRVAIVIEGEPGYTLTGGGDSKSPDYKEPWYWGMTYKEAEQIAAEMNAKLGYTEREVWQIVNSSMFPKGKRSVKRSRRSTAR